MNIYSVSFEECIDLAVSYISDSNADLKLSNTKLKSLFSVATAQTHFLFKGSFYDQIDGVAIGSPLAPVLANLFMGHHEKINYGWKIFRTQDMLMIQFAYFTWRIKLYYFLTILILGTLTSDSLWKKK